MTHTSKPQTKTSERSLPEGWQWVKFGDVIAESQPGFASGQRDPKGVIQLRMNNVDTRGNLVWDKFLRVPADNAAIEKFLILMDFVVWDRKWEMTAIFASFSRENALKKPGFRCQMGHFEKNHKFH